MHKARRNRHDVNHKKQFYVTINRMHFYNRLVCWPPIVVGRHEKQIVRPNIQSSLRARKSFHFFRPLRKASAIAGGRLAESGELKHASVACASWPHSSPSPPPPSPPPPPPRAAGATKTIDCAHRIFASCCRSRAKKGARPAWRQKRFLLVLQAQMDVITVRLLRSESSLPWGFDLQPPNIVKNVSFDLFAHHAATGAVRPSVAIRLSLANAILPSSGGSKTSTRPVFTSAACKTSDRCNKSPTSSRLSSPRRPRGSRRQRQRSAAPKSKDAKRSFRSRPCALPIECFVSRRRSRAYDSRVRALAVALDVSPPFCLRHSRASPPPLLRDDAL